MVTDEAAGPVVGKDMIQREAPDVDESRSALINEWQARVKEARAHWKKDFDRMRRNMEFAAGKQWPGQRENDQRYMANLVQRVLKTTVAALYARNPTITVGRRKRLDFKLWDGRQESAVMAVQLVQAAQAAIMSAMGAAAATMPPPDPAAVAQAQALIADIQQGVARRELFDKLAKTLACLAEYFMSEGTPPFRSQMKHMVRRARTTGVGYVKLGFQRAMELSEEQSGKLADMAERLAAIGQLQADIADGETDPHSAEAEELRLSIEAIKAEPEAIVREGVAFSFPHSTRIIPSPATEKLMGWVGCDWLAEEVMLTPARVKQIYGKDVGRTYTAYRVAGGTPQAANYKLQASGKDGLVCVLHIYDRSTGLELVVADGYPDFLREPASPKIFIEQFFPYFAVTFNDVENEGELFPKSDVELLRHIQLEYNRSKEARRQHRFANRPLYLAPAGALEEEEEKSLEAHPPHAVIKINGLKEGGKASDILMPVQKVPVDPNLYSTDDLFNDLTYVTGNQEAVLGGMSGGTATESNIAEGSRRGTLALDGDDLDEMLTSLMRATGQVLLTEMDEETVKKIVGPGFVWPVLSRREVMEEMWLEVKAGSSGRPDQARDAATFERLVPILVQVPGISPRWLAEKAVTLADDNVDLAEAVIEGLPSILAQNRIAQASTGDPASDPNEQGPEGSDKNRSRAAGGTSQPQFPAGETGTQ